MKELLTFSFIRLALASSGSDSSCRCRRHQSCWPVEQEWTALNSSVQGNLQTIQPVAAPATATNGPARPSPNNGPIPPGEQPSQEQCNEKIGRHGPNSTRAAF
ncbi:6-hydroxy-D-nicotine oxidase [Penicillium canescens]|nr:6-hydroxy-D-nicotine oxidase [Penicillium canescens]